MIPSRHTKNATFSAPILNLLVDNPHMEKVRTKSIYQPWQGENIVEIKQKHADNPYTLYIGTPNTDEQMQQDRVFFIQSYLSYNQVTKVIEKRQLIPYRNVEKVYIGKQRIDEHTYGSYATFINGNVVAEDLVLLETKQSVRHMIEELSKKVQLLEAEVRQLRTQTQTQPIYR